MYDPFIKLGFEVDKLIGRGGMAEVYLATQISLNRQVALKVMDANVGDDSFTERFLNEGRLIASLNHPNIITIYDIGVLDDGRHFISMEYINGGDLEDKLKHGALSEEESVDILRHLLGCLQLVHDKGIIHRDVKPANILFRDDGSIALTDFGIAKELTGDIKLTQVGGTLGSPAYMSPEQSQGKKLSSASDIYSAGVVFLEMLSGKNPYEGDSFVTTSMNHIQMDIPELPIASQRFQLVLNNMLAKDPYSRYNHIDELFADLERCLQNNVNNKQKAIAQQKTKHLALVVGGLSIGLLLGGYLFYTNSTTSSSSSITKTSDKKTIHVNALPKEKGSFFSRLFSPHKQEINTYLSLAEKAKQQGHLVLPEETSAYFYYQEILTLDTDNAKAKRGLSSIKSTFIDMAEEAYNENRLMTPKLNNAYYFYQQAERVAGRDTKITAGYKKIAHRYLQLAHGALDNFNVAQANQYIDRGLMLDPQNAELLRLRDQAKVIKMPKRLIRNIGKTFKDIGEDLVD